MSQKTFEHPVIAYAKRISIQKRDGYSQVSVINPWQGTTGLVQDWYLVPAGEKIPDGIETTKVIFVPIKKIMCTSTTHLAMIEALEETGSVKGFSGLQFIGGKESLKKVADNSIREIGFDDNFNKELILDVSPDLFIAYGVGSESVSYVAKLKELGIKVFFDADYLETDPLGKAEWIKLFGALYCKEPTADSIFTGIVKEYNQIKAFVNENSKSKPYVMLGLPFRDTWYISPGNSYINKLIEDAGGSYLWSKSVSDISMPTSLENVYIKAMKAEYWLNTGSAGSKKEIISIDSRLGDLPCFKNGKLYNNNKRITQSGANDYWEGGSLNPQSILRDISTILHPELFPGQELYYYTKIK